MSTTRAHRRHTVRIAAITTLLVMLSYVIAAIVVNLIVTKHLVANVDTRLLDRIEDTRQQASRTPTIGPGNDRDIDDAPSFLWSISPGGAVTVLTPGAPPLPTPANGTASRSPFMLAVPHSDSMRDTSTAQPLSRVRAWRIRRTSSRPCSSPRSSLARFLQLQSSQGRCSSACGQPPHRNSFAGGRRNSPWTRPTNCARRFQSSRPRSGWRSIIRATQMCIAKSCNELAARVHVFATSSKIFSGWPGPTTSPATTVSTSPLMWPKWRKRARSDSLPSPRRKASCCKPDVWVQGRSSFRPRGELVDRLAGVLIDNACKFAGQGGRVEVSVRISGNRIVLRVDDSGPGIPEDQRDAVFDRFHRATDSVVGTGLGLAIADSVIRSTEGTWDIGVAELGGARMEASWRRAGPRRSRVGPTEVAPLSESLA